jgi:uncharacterized membrane protein YdbT with pleckstrin-like domain
MATVEYRPTFILWTSFLAQLPMTLFFALWSGLFFGGMLSALVGHPASPGGMFGGQSLVIGSAALVLFPVVTLMLKTLNYGNTVYRVLPDRIEIDEGFLTQHRKEVRLSAVREVNLRRGVLQRMTGLGSIYLATMATGQGPGWQWSAVAGGTSTSGSGVMLMDLANSEAAYQELLGRMRATKARAEEAAQS